MRLSSTFTFFTSPQSFPHCQQRFHRNPLSYPRYPQKKDFLYTKLSNQASLLINYTLRYAQSIHKLCISTNVPIDKWISLVIKKT